MRTARGPAQRKICTKEYAIRVAYLAIAALALLGCGSPKRTDPTTKSPPPIPLDTTANTGPVAITQRDENGHILWHVESDKSQIVYGGEKKLSGSLEKVNGDLYENGKLVSTFRADSATADQEENRLELEGKVEVTEMRESATLIAQKVTWDGKQQQIRASGDVRVVAKSYQMGPFKELWASPDLMHVGTPDVFKSGSVDQGRNADSTTRAN